MHGAKLDACLLTDAEFALGAAGWHAFDDPFPAWDVDSHDDAITATRRSCTRNAL